MLLLALCAVVVVACTAEPDQPAAERSASPVPQTEDVEVTAAARKAAGDGEPDERSDHTDLQKGVDVSYHSGEVDWVALRQAGHTFGIVKATEGVDLSDPAFEGHWPRIKRAGMIRGAYHFYVTEDDPVEQARFFNRSVDLDSGDLAPVVDIELIGHDTQAGLGDRLAIFLEELEAHYGVKPIIYTAPNFWDAHFDARFGDHPLWVAEYGVSEPRLPSGWSEWHMWQWQNDAEVPGAAKGADLSRVNRDGADLSVLMIP